MSVQEKPVKKAIWKRWWFWGIVVIIVIVIAVNSGGNNTANTASTNNATKTASTASTSKTAASPSQSAASTQATPPAPAVKTYPAGMYKVGTDIPAGEYVLVADSTAYFQIAKDSTGTMDSVLANDNFDNRSIITVKAGQYLTMNDCTAYAFNDAPKVTPGNDGYLPEGMYKVGVDIPAGEYKVSTDDQGYVEVSSDSTHDMGQIISNDNFQGTKYITIKAGEYIKLSGAKIKVK